MTDGHPYAPVLSLVEKPARYLGGEYLAVRKNWSSVDVRFVLAFPDVYDIGMSHLGTKIIYSVLNRHPRIACERAFTPWPDMERELRAHGLPLVSLESARPLRDFDAIGCSLQYELTFTNVLTLLDLGGVPLHACDRGEHDPLVWGGGPTACHPEPMAPFFDLFLIGDAEEALPRLLLADAENRRLGLARRERLVRLAALGGVYVPSLYHTRHDDLSRREVVDQPLDGRVPLPVRRTVLDDLDRFPFPADAPVAWAEAVFDRAAVEIARGCQEGCRFCQAGMIYRPLRERHPQAIIDAAVGAVKCAGYDEASLTALSTADYSCITPLVARLMAELRREKVALGLSSLRAYGLDGRLLDEVATLRTTGLTFAPEAGSQRLRDVINKNVTEDDITRALETLFARGWSRVKLYFMIGLPTEQDQDVLDIARLAGRLRRRGRQLRRGADLTLSASSHVPKPHTPFQWCEMCSVEELQRKQHLLRNAMSGERIEVKWHEASISWLEGLLARGDRRLAPVIERAWRAGARFDGWDEHFSLARWHQAFAEEGVDPDFYRTAIPVDARLPWDHIDVGVEKSFLVREWQRAERGLLSPPCGKPIADHQEAVCYQCGIGCDLGKESARRRAFQESISDPVRRERDECKATRRKPRECTESTRPRLTTQATQQAPVIDGSTHSRPQPTANFDQGEGTRYRIRYTKLGPVALVGHLDTVRLLGRMIRRTGIAQIYTRGFHPKPEMAFAPALGLGVASLGEIVDVRLDVALADDELRALLERAAPAGIDIVGVARLADQAASLARRISLADYAARFSDDHADLGQRVLARWASETPLPTVTRLHKGETRTVEVAGQMLRVWRPEGDELAHVVRALPGSGACLLALRLRITGNGVYVRPREAVESLLGMPPPMSTRYARLGFWFENEDGTLGDPLSPLSGARL